MNKQQIDFVVHASHGIGGVTSWCFRMAGLLRRTLDAQVVAIGDSKDDFGSQLDGQVLHLPSPKVTGEMETGFWTTRPQVRRVRLPSTLAELDPSAADVIRTNSVLIPNYIEFGYRLAAIALAEGRKTCCIGVCHTDEIHYYDLLRRYEPVIAAFVGVSKRCCRTLEEMLPHRARDIFFLPCGVEVPDQVAQVSTDTRLRLLYTGRFAVRQKRILDFVKLIHLLNERGIQYRFDFVGDGPDKQRFRSEMEGLTEWVRILEPMSHATIDKIYRHYDAFVLASEYEGTSVAMLEAMACRLVPVVTKVSGAEDVIDHGENGFLVDVGDLDTMAAYIGRLASDRQLLRRLSASAGESVCGKYLLRNGAEELLKIIERATHNVVVDPALARTCLDCVS